jgi:hypothetical protein
MESPIHLYYIWYGNWGSSPAPAILGDFAQDLGGSRYLAIAGTYASPDGVPVPNALTYGGSTTDSYSRGASLADADINAVVTSALTSNRLPTDPNGLYMVMTSKDVSETNGFCTNFCGWHRSATINGANIKYGFVGDGDACPSSCQSDLGSSPNGDPGADGMANVLAHELIEAVTDPGLNAWYVSGNGAEAGDLCAWNFGPTYSAANGSQANIHLGARDYLLQQEWINLGAGYCGMRVAGHSDLTGDFDGDRFADYADQTLSSGKFYVHRNLQNGTFTGIGHDFETGTSCAPGQCDVLLGDFDKDGLTDYADHDLATGKLFVHRNLGNGFAAVGDNYMTATTCSGSDCDVFVADFTGDGFADYADHQPSTGQLWVHENLGHGTFAAVGVNWATATTCSGSDCNVFVGDFTGDGKADYADHSISTGKFYVHENLGGKFAPVGTDKESGTTCTNRDCTVLIGDFDRDGMVDYADHQTSTGMFWIHRNLGTSFDPGNFGPNGGNAGTTCSGANCGVLGQ